MIQINQKLSLINFTDRNDTSRIKYLVVHYFGAFGSAEATCAYFYNTYRGASAHYFVDDTSIFLKKIIPSRQMNKKYNKGLSYD